MSVHFRLRAEEAEGFYNFRIYSFNEDELFDRALSSEPALTSAGQLYQHAKLCSLVEPVVLPEDSIVSWSPLQQAKENELEVGVPSFDNYTLTLYALKELEQLVRECRKIDKKTEIWLEVTLEQRADDLPTSSTDSGFIWPRKERCVWWGKLVPLETSGKVNDQELKTKETDTRDASLAHMSSVERVALTDHDGELKLTFRHWMNVRCSPNPKEWLDQFKAKTLPESGGIEVSLAVVLADLVRYISPTKLVGMSDFRLIRDEGPGVPFHLSVHGANFFLPVSIGTDSERQHMLRHWYVDYKQGANYKALFFYDEEDSGDNSLYSDETLGDVFIKFQRDILLFGQPELPTFDEVLLAPANVENDRHYLQKYWHSATRWLFLPVTGGPLPIYVDTDEETIEYQPCATYLKRCKVEMPSTDGQLPHPAWSEIVHEWAEGDELEYKTMLRFQGIEYVDGNPTLSPRGYELKFKFELLNPMHHATKVFYSDGDTELEFDNWAEFHAAYQMSIWGRVSAKFSVTSKSVGIVPFGADATVNGAQVDEQRKVQGMLDIGEFPLLRFCDFEVGLMPEGELIRAVVYDISKAPGANVELSLIEVSTIVQPEEDDIDGPAMPPPPEEEEEPPEHQTPAITTPTNGATILGPVSPVSITAGDAGAVHLLKVYVDGSIFEIVPGKTASTTYSFMLDTTTLSEGSHTIKAVSYASDGTSKQHQISVTVDNVA